MTESNKPSVGSAPADTDPPKTQEAQESMVRAATRLREAQLRVTAQRMAVLTAIEELSGHPDVEAIRAEAQTVLGGLSLQATYNVLRVLTDVGLVRCTQLSGHPARYETERADNHHHFACRICGDITDTDCAIGAAPCLQPRLPESYQVDEAAVTFWGTCPGCAGAAEQPDGRDHQ
ncbi:Fur family transcriptional regulator [Streptomyces sp. NPDC002619]|uniref:Fur family transcriptional regulator n=2 Tax=Streptomyces TaxID=1883 RepID=UPI00367613B4